MPNTRKPKGLLKTNVAVPLVWVLLMTVSAHADTVYRCGNAYSASDQCANGQSAEVKASSVLRDRAQDKPSHVSNEQQEAAALEKKRLQAERQATQNAPIRLSASPNPPSRRVNTDVERNPSRNKGKHARKPPSPYFTAKDPNAPPKKKSTAKAVPAALPSSP